MSSPAASPVPGAPRSRVPRIAGAAVERARLTVVPRTRAVRAPRVPFVLLVSALLLSGVVGLLMFNTSMQQASFTTTTLEQRATNLLAREQALTAELEELRDPQRLAVAARKQGMRTPPAPAFLHADGTVSGVPTPARPNDGERVNGRPPVLPAVLDPAPQIVEVEAPRATRAAGGLPASDAGATADSSADTSAGNRETAAAGGRNEAQQPQQDHQPQETRQDRRQSRR